MLLYFLHKLTLNGTVRQVISAVAYTQVSDKVKEHLIGTGYHKSRVSGAVNCVQKGGHFVPTIIYL